MDEQKRPRAWVYARIPGDYDGTMNSYKVCSMQALHDGCDIVGGSIDERGGWLLRPGYRDTSIFPKFSARKPNAPKAKALEKAAGAAAATACKPLAANCVCRMKSAVCVTMSACC